MESQRIPLHMVLLVALVVILPVDLWSEVRQKFSFIPLQLQAGRLIALKSTDKTPPEARVQAGRLIVLKLRYLNTPKDHFWKGTVAGGLFDRMDPICVVTSTSSSPLLSTTSERLIEYQDDYPNKSYALSNLTLYGPAFSKGNDRIAVGMRIFNVRLGEDERRSLFKEASGVVRNQIREVEPFIGTLDRITGRFEEVYNTNIRIRQELPLVDSSLYRGYWLVIPQHKQREIRFAEQFTSGRYGLSLDGTRVLQLTRGPEGELKEGVQDLDVTNRAPIFLVLELDEMDFEPTRWLESVNMVSSLPVPANVPENTVLRLRQAADDGLPDAEAYIYRLLRQQFYFQRDSAASDADKLKAARNFINLFIAVPFRTGRAGEAFLKDLPAWLHLPPQDEFQPDVQDDAKDTARVLTTRLQKGDISFSDPLFVLSPIYKSGRPLATLRERELGDDASPSQIRELIDGYLSLTRESGDYLKSEIEQLTQSFLLRFSLPESAGSWGLETFRSELEHWKNNPELLQVLNNRIHRRLGTASAKAPLEGQWNFEIVYRRFHGVESSPRTAFQANGKAFLFLNQDAKQYDVYVAIWVVKVGQASDTLVLGFIRGVLPADESGWAEPVFQLSMEYVRRLGIADFAQPSTSAFKYSQCTITKQDPTRAREIKCLFQTPQSSGDVILSR